MARQRIALLGGHGGHSGVPRHIHQLCNLLGDTMDITVFSDVDQGGYSFARAQSINHVVVPGLATSLNPVRVSQAWSRFQTAMAANGPFDVVWAHARLSLPFARRYVRQMPDAPRLIATYHGSPFAGRSFAQSMLARRIERTGLSKTPPHDLVFLSQTDRASFNGLPLHNHTIHEIANCSDLGALPPAAPPDYPTLIMTTRASAQKNLIAAARLFALLPDTYRLVLRGMGTDTQTRAQFIGLLGAQTCKRITFGGPVDDVRPDLVASDGYLLTSHYEGLSIGALEAFEAGLPIFMPAIGGAAEMRQHHPQAAIIDLDDLPSAATQIDALVSAFRANRDDHIKRNQTAWAQTFDPAIWAKKIWALLDQTANR